MAVSTRLIEVFHMSHSLPIHTETFRQISTAAAACSPNECMGILAAPRGARALTHAVALPAQASMAHAEASPGALKACASNLRTRGLVPRGIYHSHGLSSVFHSGTDRATMLRLLPAM